jgi:hypothetical protein
MIGAMQARIYQSEKISTGDRSLGRTGGTIEADGEVASTSGTEERGFIYGPPRGEEVPHLERGGGEVQGVGW